MVKRTLHRRSILTALAATTLMSQVAKAEDVVDLSWADLLPEGETAAPNMLQGFIDHESAPLSSQQPASSGVRADWNGQIVRLPGFIVPIDQRATGVVAFILVPFVGACVHVLLIFAEK